MAKHYTAHGPYPIVYKTTNRGSTWTVMYAATLDAHTHFHYVMRIVQHLMLANITYVTDSDTLYRTGSGGNPPTDWQVLFAPTRLVPCPQDPTKECPIDIHLHGLALYAPDTNPTNAKVYVGSGYGNWGTHSHGVNSNRVWRGLNGGLNATDWAEITGTGFPQPPANTCCHVGDAGGCTITVNNICLPQPPPSPLPDSVHCGCSSVYTMAVPPTDANTVYAGTFGSENDAGKTMMGRGLGVVRSTNALATPPTAVLWETLNRGLCPNGPPVNCPTTGDPPPGSLSLFVGTVAIDPNGQYAYIATLNGLYRRLVTDGPAVAWTNITGGNPPITRPRFEAIAVDPNNAAILYAGTSEEPNFEPRIFKSTNRGASWDPLTLPLNLEATRAWSDRFRVRDIQVRGGSVPTGQPKAYAVIEGSGIYVYNQPPP